MAEAILRLNCLYMEIEVYGGSDIPTAIQQMVQLANRTGLSIWATMNGVRTLARPGDDAMLITEAWSYALKHSQSHASAPLIDRAASHKGTTK